MQRLNLDQLGAFAAVIELGSFSAAAERLQLTQPAVSLQVRQLEKRLGTLLVERVGRRARPTAAGAALLPHAARIDEAVAAALDAVGAHAAGERPEALRPWKRLPSQRMQKASLPMPLLVGSSTVSEMAVANIASTALPPFINILNPACAASGCEVATQFAASSGLRGHG